MESRTKHNKLGEDIERQTYRQTLSDRTFWMIQMFCELSIISHVTIENQCLASVNEELIAFLLNLN